MMYCLCFLPLSTSSSVQGNLLWIRFMRMWPTNNVYGIIMFAEVLRSKWVWPGHTTITHCRPTHKAQNPNNVNSYYSVSGTVNVSLSLLQLMNVFEPWPEISNNVVCATSKGSDQPAHACSLIRAIACRFNVLWLLSFWPNIYWSF